MCSCIFDIFCLHSAVKKLIVSIYNPSIVWHLCVCICPFSYLVLCMIGVQKKFPEVTAVSIKSDMRQKLSHAVKTLRRWAASTPVQAKSLDKQPEVPATESL